MATQTMIPVAGGALWAEHRGAGSPVVLLHGAGMDSRLWDSVVEPLARTHTVIRYDARGLGRSTAAKAPFSDVGDLAAVLDHFGLPSAALAGLSLGGEVCLDFALAHAERVTSLALIGTNVSGHEWREDPGLAAFAKARSECDIGRLAELELEIWASLGDRAPGWDLIARMVRENAPRRLVGGEFARYPLAALPHVGGIGAPTLVILAECEHPEIVAIAERLAGDIPGAGLETIPGADHYLPLRTPDRLTELLLKHLA